MAKRSTDIRMHVKSKHSPKTKKRIAAKKAMLAKKPKANRSGSRSKK